jgi:hypothetical protein
MRNLVLTIALAITACLSGTASAQTAPADMFYDLTPAPEQSELSFDTEPEDYCVCLHKVCYPAGDQGQYIKCRCEWMSCVGLDLKPY